MLSVWITSTGGDIKRNAINTRVSSLIDVNLPDCFVYARFSWSGLSLWSPVTVGNKLPANSARRHLPSAWTTCTWCTRSPLRGRQ